MSTRFLRLSSCKLDAISKKRTLSDDEFIEIAKRYS
jgi:hypothetical protein